MTDTPVDVLSDEQIADLVDHYEHAIAIFGRHEASRESRALTALRELQQRRALAAVQAQPVTVCRLCLGQGRIYVGAEWRLCSCQPQPASARPDESALRMMWDAGFQTCRDYTDNWVHCQGEQKERRVQAALSRVPAPAVSPYEQFAAGFQAGLGAVDKFGEQHETVEEAWADFQRVSQGEQP
jgi:hypothetical protein